MDGSQYTPPQPRPAPPPVPPAPAPPPGYAPPGQPPAPKKRTWLIVVLIVLAMLLACCCIAAGAGWWVYDQASKIEDEVVLAPEDRERLDEWYAAMEGFPTGEFETQAADERQRSLAEAFLAEVYPDFELADVVIDPGFQEDDGVWVFDYYVIRGRMIDDPAAEMAVTLSIAPEGAEGLSRDDLEIEQGDEAVQLLDRAWALYYPDSKQPLVGGIEDESVRSLVRQATADWPEGLVGWISILDDGTGDVKLETWDAVSGADTPSYVETVYEPDGSGGWELVEYDIVVEER